MSLDTVLRQGRRAFLSRMRARCRVWLVDSSLEVTDLETGEVTPFREVLYESLPAYTRYPGMAWETNHPVGGAVIVDSRLVVRVPFEFDGALVSFPVNSVIEWLADPDNPKLVGSEFLVRSFDDQSQATAQRVICEDTQRGVVV